MIAALFALAATLIIGGIVAVFEGFPYVRLESGMAMVNAGSVVGSAGVVLLGLAVVASMLKRVERVLRSGVTAGTDTLAETPEKPADLIAGDFGLGELPADPVVPAPAPAPSISAMERPRIEPSLSLSSEPVPPSPPSAREPELPMPGLTPPAPPVEPAAAPQAESVAPAERKVPPIPPRPPEPPRFERPEAAVLRPSLDTAPEPEAVSIAPTAPARTVVGRYSSGGNTYVMFDDGSIEADTPNGRFTFSSLDELKAFVDSGGEAGTRGAA